MFRVLKAGIKHIPAKETATSYQLLMVTLQSLVIILFTYYTLTIIITEIQVYNPIHPSTIYIPMRLSTGICGSILDQTT